MRPVPALTYSIMVTRVKAQKEQFDKLVQEFVQDVNMKVILDNFKNMYNLTDVQLAGKGRCVAPNCAAHSSHSQHELTPGCPAPALGLSSPHSILDETEKQLAKQLDWSFEAVEIAQKGLKDLGTKMKDKLEEIQKKVREHMVATLISGIFTALFSVAELFVNPFGSIMAGKKCVLCKSAQYLFGHRFHPTTQPSHRCRRLKDLTEGAGVAKNFNKISKSWKGAAQMLKDTSKYGAFIQKFAYWTTVALDRSNLRVPLRRGRETGATCVR